MTNCGAKHGHEDSKAIVEGNSYSMLASMCGFGLAKNFHGTKQVDFHDMSGNGTLKKATQQTRVII